VKAPNVPHAASVDQQQSATITFIPAKKFSAEEARERIFQVLEESHNWVQGMSTPELSTAPVYNLWISL
jgi:hypothetical protein